MASKVKCELCEKSKSYQGQTAIPLAVWVGELSITSPYVWCPGKYAGGIISGIIERSPITAQVETGDLPVKPALACLKARLNSRKTSSLCSSVIRNHVLCGGAAAQMKLLPTQLSICMLQ